MGRARQHQRRQQQQQQRGLRAPLKCLCLPHALQKPPPGTLVSAVDPGPPDPEPSSTLGLLTWGFGSGLWALGSLTQGSPWPELPPTPGLAALGLPLALCLHEPFSWVSHTHLCPVLHCSPQSICVLSPVHWFAHPRSHKVGLSLPLPSAHEVSCVHSLLFLFFFFLASLCVACRILVP